MTHIVDQERRRREEEDRRRRQAESSFSSGLLNPASPLSPSWSDSSSCDSGGSYDSGSGSCCSD
nr:hypothetical protein [Escherichia coli]